MSQPPQHSPTPIPGPSSNHQQYKPRQNLPKAGVNLLQEHTKKWKGQELNLAMRKSLLAKLHEIPGCDYYTLQHLTSWLKARNLYTPRTHGQETPSRFTSLNESVRGQLAALLSMELEPSQEKVRLWAAMVKATGATYTDVVDWIQHMQIQLKKQNMQAANRLPTPANTITPEPSPVLKTVSPGASPVAPSPIIAYTGTHSYYNPVQQSQSPPQVEVLFHNFQVDKQLAPLRVQQMQAHRGSPPPFSPISPIISPTTPIHTSPPPAYATNIPSQTHNRGPLRPPVQRPTMFPGIVAQSIVDAAASPTTSKDASPTSAAEFNKLFEPYGVKLSQLILELESKLGS